MILAKECFAISTEQNIIMESKGLDFFKEKAISDALQFFNSKDTEQAILKCASVGEFECYFTYESFLKYQYPSEAIDHMNLFLNSKFLECGYIFITSSRGVYVRWRDL